MVKIKKNLSDEEMFRGFKEELNFENTVYQEEEQTSSKIKGVVRKQQEILLNGEALERLNRFLLEISLECLKNKKGGCTWRVAKEGETIVIKPVTAAQK